MIVVAAYIKAKDGTGDELEKAMKGLIPKFRNDPGCVAYEIHRRVDNDDNFFLYEKYENDEALKAHMSTPHYKEMFAAMKPFLDGKGEIVMYREI